MEKLKKKLMGVKGQGIMIDAFIWVIVAVLMTFIAFQFMDTIDIELDFRDLIANLGNSAMTLTFYDLIPPVLMLSIPLGIVIMIRRLQGGQQQQQM